MTSGDNVTGSEALCIGLISGTSVDGIDVAVVRIDRPGKGARPELVAFETVPYPLAVRAELLSLYDDQANAVPRLCALNVVVGECFAEATLGVCARAGIDLDEVAVIGSHGQTVWHQPELDPALPLSTPSTLQIGEAAVISARTGVPVMADFRVADMAVGGQGAPLAPYFDWAVLGADDRGRCVQNIGGIGNVTWLPAGAGVGDVVAFDTGPGNILIDGLVTLLSGGEQTFDRDGELGAQGTVDRALLAAMLDDPYLHMAPPKTTGREYYGLAQCRDLLRDATVAEGALADPDPTIRQRAWDLIATATQATARSIADAYRRWLPAMPDEVLVNGGGSRNPTLMRMLADLLAPIPVMATDALGYDGDAKEAMAFALMAHDALAGLPTNIPGATGASRAVTLGKFTRL
ncbi:MAG TPA: anhydro-N-acetylmuramic acid kinase [Thermomicrobiales bacterium]|nr:anhydro-N-acetylmuramic acid kinase [Thermomicrobiales bacterium]